MIVYRVEHHVWGDGPYNGGHAIEEMADDHCDDREVHPNVWTDLDPERVWGEFTEEHVCGFASLEALELWFEGWRGDLHAHGFVVREFEVDEADVIPGGRQLAFIRNKARLIASRPIVQEVMA